MSESAGSERSGSENRQHIELSEQRGLEMVPMAPPTAGNIVNMASPAPEADNFED